LTSAHCRNKLKEVHLSTQLQNQVESYPFLRGQEQSMAYNKLLAERVRMVLRQHPEIIEKKMFGGVGYLLGGNLACGVQGDDLIVRVGEAQNDFALSQPFVRPFLAARGRPMAGWVLVAPGATDSDQELLRWVNWGIEFAATLPEKK
jgi:TfoX/Sxy family transcriptional regulator of competence genes